MDIKGQIICADNLPSQMIGLLESDGWNVLRVPFCGNVIESIGFHPDIQLFVVSDEEVVIHTDMPYSFVKKLQSVFKRVIYGVKRLERDYPNDILYSGKRVGDFFFHKIDSTDPTLLKRISLAGYEDIHVTQGYTGCSVLNVGGDAIITADIGIAKEADFFGLDVLLIGSGSVVLPGLDHGFIGGTGGWDGFDKIYFCGNIESHPDSEAIKKFINDHNMNIVNLGESDLIDYGSLIFVSSTRF